MSKVIIENRSDLPDLQAIDYVQQVMKQGRISDNGKQYCYLTTFKGSYCVATHRNKQSDRFVVYNS